MSSTPVRHPDDRTLVAFKLSKLDQRQIALVNKHLKECITCRGRLASLSTAMQMPAPPENAPDPGTKRTPRRSSALVWSATGGALVLLGLGIVWAIGAFDGKPSAAVNVVANTPLSSEPKPSTVTVQSPADVPSAAPPMVPTSAPTTAVKRAPAKASPTVATSPPPATSTLAAADPPAQKAAAAEKPADNTADASATFFNGKDLTGWQGPAVSWRVEKGAITGSLPASQKQAAFLSSRRRYSDFDLMFRASVADGIGDCGVQFRSLDRTSDKVPVAGPLCAIFGKDAPNEHRTGSLLIEPGHKVEKSPSQQRVERFVDAKENHFRIRCQGKHVLIEVNGVKMVNGDFPSLPDQGIIVWKIDADRPPHKVTFSNIKFTDLSQSPPEVASERPSLHDLELLRAEMKFETAMKKADETLLNRFDSEAARLKRSAHRQDKELVDVVEHEKELFKEKGLIPWSRPMRKSLLQYGKELHDAQRAVGTAFDAAIERAEKSHNEKLKEALLAEAGQVLAPREVAAWQRTSKKGEVYRRIFYSDGTFSEGDTQAETTSRFWTPPIDDVLTLEFPDKEDSTSTNEQLFLLSSDGKTLTTKSKKDNAQVWKQAEEAQPNGGSPDSPAGG
jgi:hypothetical protein